MFEGCLQAMAVYLAALGYTLDRDGWRFEPVPDETYPMRCRGQVTPALARTRLRGLRRGGDRRPEPTLYADILCTVDGLKAFHAAAWACASSPTGRWTRSANCSDAIVEERPRPRPTATCASTRARCSPAPGDGRRRPSGPSTAPSTASRRVARLPGPPYHFMSRVTHLDGRDGGDARRAAAVEVEYDVPRRRLVLRRERRAHDAVRRPARGGAPALRLAGAYVGRRPDRPGARPLLPQPRRHRHGCCAEVCRTAARCSPARRSPGSRARPG